MLEAKNLRQWIYPRAQEFHQLLSKAAMMQVGHPEHSIVPVLVCRRANPTTLMAEQLGFYVIQTHHQYVRPYLVDTADGRRQFNEVNEELAYDMVPHRDAVDPMVRHFRTPLQAVAARTAERWALSGPAGAVSFAELRVDALNYTDSAHWLDQLATDCEGVHGQEMAWRTTSLG